ncbi:hypothetical protein ASG73_16365 [Janibacter sp. Soil728]|uniref:DUF6270 domain-containing protein n=1 Tax=Janibacter sp. Soil728 TaxID=1736393 RepID=UPI0006FBCC0A|nr:DUF6270 domain-containing protein [Janibacter sp. Soil728]KRE35508.1 hypothetical protein ASG73_16365 [Janibacter sp. Soil728]
MSTDDTSREDTGSGRVRTFIYGSCVSRDTLETMADTHELLAYVARQSAISAGRPAEGVWPQLTHIESPFQRRMVQGDIEGNALSEIARRADEIDLLVLDLIDERGGVIEVGGGYVSRHAELWQAGGDAATRDGHRVDFGTDEHFALWSPAVARLAAGIAELGLSDRVILLETEWASTMDDGESLDIPDWDLPPHRANVKYRRYYDRVRALGWPVVSLPAELTASTRDHKWGASPFHYTAAAYAHLAAGLRSSLSRR